MKWFQYRDIGYNRVIIPNSDFKTKVHEGFYFASNDELIDKLCLKYNCDPWEININDNSVFRGLLVGFIKDNKPIEYEHTVADHIIKYASPEQSISEIIRKKYDDF